HSLKFRPVCVARSDWNCIIESDDSVRLGFRVVRGLSNTGAERLLAERKKMPFTSLDDFKRRARLNKDELRVLASIGAFNCLAGHRRDALWNIEKEIREDDLFEGVMNETQRSQRSAFIMRGAVGTRPTSSTLVGRGVPTAPIQATETSPLLPMSYDERIQADYTGMQLTTGSHPMALLRDRLPGIWRAADLPKAKPGSIIRIAG